jgi:hypothetical protein
LQEPQEQSAIYRPHLAAPGGSDVRIAIRVRDPNAFAPRLRSFAAEVDPTIRLTGCSRSPTSAAAKPKRTGP